MKRKDREERSEMDYASKGPGVKHGFMATRMVPKKNTHTHFVLLIYVFSLPGPALIDKQ